MSSKVKITVEHKDGVERFEHDAVFFVAFSKEGGEVSCNSGIVGQTSLGMMADQITESLIMHDKKLSKPISRDVAMLITLANIVGFDPEEEE